MPTWVTDVAQAVLSVSGALGIVFSGAWAIARYTVNREVLPSLKQNRDAYKAWNDEIYRRELERNENSAHAIDTIQQGLSQLAKELQQIRINTTKHDETLVALPGILTSLNDTLARHARTDDKLGETLSQMGRDVSETKIRIAHIMGKLDMKSRSDVADIASAPR